MTMRSRRTPGLWLVVAGLAVGLLVAGCAAESGARAGGQASGPSTSSSTAPAAPTSGSAPGQTSTSVDRADVVLRGTVRRGVEGGCLLLDAQDKQAYLLLDADRSALRPGARVEVVGQRVDQIVSTCNEGVALSVASVRPLP
jgi:hypothetical protein